MPPVVGSKVRFTSGDRAGEWEVVAVKNNSSADVQAADGEVVRGIPFYMLEGAVGQLPLAVPATAAVTVV
jgi:hypothetical protein